MRRTGRRLAAAALILALCCGLAAADGTGGITWTLDAAGVLTIGGSGAMPDYTHDSRPWAAEAGAIRRVVIGSGVTGIGSAAFMDCTGLTEVILPEGVAVLGDAAFAGCTGLTEIAVPGSAVSIGSFAFLGCTGLTGVTLGEGVEAIGDGAFYGCDSLEDITLPESVATVGDAAFAGCTGLADAEGFVVVRDVLYGYAGGGGEITVPQGVRTISVEAFAGFSRLTAVTLPGSVTGIGGYAFYDCSGLTRVTYGGTEAAWSEVEIGEGNECLMQAEIRFAGGTGVLDLPDSLTAVGSGAFAGLPGVEAVRLPAGIGSIAPDAFDPDVLLYVPNAAWAEWAEANGYAWEPE